jgi:Mce-associated membrane protein
MTTSATTAPDGATPPEGTPPEGTPPDDTLPDDTLPDDTTPHGGGAAAGGTRARGWRDPLRATGLGLAIVAAGFAAWSGWSWHSAAQGGPPPASQLRDQVLQAGEQAVQNFNTLDYRTVGKGIALWEQSSAGTLHDEIASGAAGFEKQITQAKTVTTGKILDGALTSLNAKAGTATIIVAIEITVRPQQGTPSVKQSRLEGRLTRTAGGWKLSGLSQAPVGAASSGKSR